MVPENIDNFIRSRDTIYFNIKTKLLFFIGIIVLCGLQIGFDIYITGDTVDLVDLVVALCHITLSLIFFILSFILRNEGCKYVIYGGGLIIIAHYLSYFIFRYFLYPFNAFWGFGGTIFWILSSCVCILSIKSNIKNNCYKNEDSQFETIAEDGKKYCIVITWRTFLLAGIYIALCIGISVIYFIFSDTFTATEQSLSIAFQLGLIWCLAAINFFAIFSWKLIIKYVYINKYVVNI